MAGSSWESPRRYCRRAATPASELSPAHTSIAPPSSCRANLRDDQMEECDAERDVHAVALSNHSMHIALGPCIRRPCARAEDMDAKQSASGAVPPAVNEGAAPRDMNEDLVPNSANQKSIGDRGMR